MHMERRALYNSLRMNWLLNPELALEKWQVEDYREIALNQLFNRLAEKEIQLDRVSFLALADEVDTPEELSDDLVADVDLSTSEQDQIFLLVFELWRRLVPEKQSLSIFCDELDFQVHAYDQNQDHESLATTEAIQDVLANLAQVLDENTDHGGDPKEVFESISCGCANDIESFLYDFIAEQLDNKNDSYATELLDNFYNYVIDSKWFDILKARLLAVGEEENFDVMIRQLVNQAISEKNLEFNFEVFSVLTQISENKLFATLVKQSLPLLQNEEDLQDLLAISIEYCQRLDLESKEKALQKILERRSKIALEKACRPNDPDFSELLRIIS